MATANHNESSATSSSKRDELLYLFGRFWLNVELRARVERPCPCLVAMTDRCTKRDMRVEFGCFASHKRIHLQ